MSSRQRGSLKMALASIRSTKWRSVLTMLGIVIGIVSVVTIIGIGEGVKAQVSGQINKFGKDLITVRPGHLAETSTRKVVTNSDVLFGLNTLSGLTVQDLLAAKDTEHVAQIAPLGVVPGSIVSDGQTFDNNLVIATTPDLPSILQQSVQYGSFFDDDTMTGAVIGRNVAQKLFGESVPLGQTFTFRGQAFIVRGMFSEFNASPLSPTANFDDAIFIPYQIVSQMTNNGTQFYSILAKPDKPSNLGVAIKNIDASIVRSHGGEQDFTVLDQQQSIKNSSDIIDLLTTFITAVAAISLLVGGIGIMNIMLVSVTERMHEIGIRKAVGATNRQILVQFMLEALVLSGVGSVIGVAIAVGTDMLLRTYTTYQPIISWQAILLASGVSIAVGVVFGTAPAVKAARKDPIEALRHE